MRSKAWLVLLALLLLWFAWPARVHHHPNGMTIKADPTLKLLAHGKPWNRKGYQITPLASYDIKSRVLAKAHYYFGQESNLSAYDLAVGWRIMSDSRVLDSLSISQSVRWYEYQWSQDPPADPATMAAQSKNMHILAATSEIERALGRTVVGDLVELGGYLVEAKASDGWTWTSSLDDGATGDHSCKVFWVESWKNL